MIGDGMGALVQRWQNFDCIVGDLEVGQVLQRGDVVGQLHDVRCAEERESRWSTDVNLFFPSNRTCRLGRWQNDAGKRRSELERRSRCSKERSRPVSIQSMLENTPERSREVRDVREDSVFAKARAPSSPI